MPADSGDGITNGSVVDVLLQYTPNYNFVEGHYYDISITAKHSYSDWTVDTIQFLTNGNNTVLTDTSNFSYSFNVMNRWNFVLNLKGVRDIDVNRVLQRIRFYATVVAWNDPTGEGTPQSTIAMGTTVIDIDDTTDKYLLPEINDKLDEAQNTRTGILQKLTDLPNTILHLFVPTSEDLNSKIDTFKTSINGKLGIIGQLGDILDYFGTSVQTAKNNPTHVIDLGSVNFNVGNHNIILWEDGQIDLYPFSSQIPRNIIRLLLWYYLCWGVVIYVRRLYMRFTVGEVVVDEGSD